MALGNHSLSRSVQYAVGPTLIILDFKVSEKDHLICVLISNTVFGIYYFENSMLPLWNNDYLVILLIKGQITNVGI